MMKPRPGARPGAAFGKIALPLLWLALAVPAFGQNLAGLDRWVLNFPKGGKMFAGHRITRCVVERTGALFVIDRAGLPVRLNLLKPIEMKALEARFASLQKAVLDPAALVTDRWQIAFRECEIDFGLKDESAVSLRLASFRLRLNAETELELAGRLESGPELRQTAAGAGLAWSLRFRGVGPGGGGPDAFPGWAEYAARVIRWFQDGIQADNQEVLAVVLDAKVMNEAEKEGPRPIELPGNTQPHLKAGMNVDYFMSNIVSGEDAHIFFRPAAYHLVQTQAFLSWRNLGDPAWLVRPYRFTIGVGGFFEFNASYFWRQGTFFLYPSYNQSFMFAYGPSVRVEFAAMVPKIVGDAYMGDLFGLGVELLTMVNIAYFLPDYFYEYFLNQYLNFVIYLLPGEGAGLDVILGVNAALMTDNFDETYSAISLSKFALSIGVRLRVDF